MADSGLYPYKKRTKSQPIEIERKKQILPFIKPKYMKEEMFNSSVMFQHSTIQPTEGSAISSEADIGRQNSRNREEVRFISKSVASKKESVVRFRLEFND